MCTVARQQHIDVVLVDTAGRMQDNEPLMRALAKVQWLVRVCGLSTYTHISRDWSISGCMWQSVLCCGQSSAVKLV